MRAERSSPSNAQVRLGRLSCSCRHRTGGAASDHVTVADLTAGCSRGNRNVSSPVMACCWLHQGGGWLGTRVGTGVYSTSPTLLPPCSFLQNQTPALDGRHNRLLVALPALLLFGQGFFELCAWAVRSDKAPGMCPSTTRRSTCCIDLDQRARMLPIAPNLEAGVFSC